MRYFILIVLFAVIHSLNGQTILNDTIYTTSGAKMPCTINSINKTHINFTNLTGIWEIYINEVLNIYTQNNTYREAFDNILIKRGSPISDYTNKVQLIANDSLSYLFYKVKHLDNLHTKFHTQYKTGTSLIVGGLLLSGLSTLAASQSMENQTGYKFELFLGLAGVGGILSTVGIIYQIDSHKYFNKARFGFDLSGVVVQIPIN